MIFTSYFGKNSRHPGAVSIAQYSPKWYEGASYRPLAPYPWMLKIADPGEYERAYQKHVLSKLNAEKVVSDLKILVEQENIVLLCFEKDPNECHRHLVAAWLKQELGLEVNELDPAPLNKPKKSQITLFSFM